MKSRLLTYEMLIDAGINLERREQFWAECGSEVEIVLGEAPSSFLYTTLVLFMGRTSGEARSELESRKREMNREKAFRRDKLYDEYNTTQEKLERNFKSTPLHKRDRCAIVVHNEKLDKAWNNYLDTVSLLQEENAKENSLIAVDIFVKYGVPHGKV